MRLIGAFLLSVMTGVTLATIGGRAIAGSPGGSSVAAPRPAGDPMGPARPKIKSLPAGVSVPTYTPGPMPFHDGERLFYQASWLGIPAANAEILLHRDSHDPDLWTAEAWIKTNRAVDVVYKMRDYLREDFRRGTFVPRTMFVRQNEGRRHDEFTVNFDPSSQLVTMRKQGPRGLQIRRFRAINPQGMASGAAMALSQPLTVGSSLIFDVFSATSRYVLKFAVTGQGHLGTAAGSFNAIKIEPSVIWMSDKSMREWASATTAWVSADERRLPLRIDAAIFIGAVRIDLVKVEEPGQTHITADEQLNKDN